MNNTPQSQTPGPPPMEAETGGVLKCPDIRELLAAYLLRELGDTQSWVVREHLRQCGDCRREAAEIGAALAMLRAGDQAVNPAATGSRLSEDRRERLARAVFHPVLDWMYRYHRWVSAVAAILVLLAALFALWHVRFRPPPLDEGIPIWRMFRSGRLPELLERARSESGQAGETVHPERTPDPGEAER